MSSKETNQKIILITGTSSGIGLISACRLAKRGHTVYATMRDVTKQDKLLEEAKRQETSVIVRSLDVTKEDTIQAVAEEIKSSHGYLDVLINNAGYGIGGPFELLADAEIREIMETNFFGAQRMIRLALPLLRLRQGARIINLSSVAGLAGIPVLGAYSSSKFALEGFSEALRHELKQFGVFVSLIEPGSFKTDIWRGNRKLAAKYHEPDSLYKSYAERMLRSQEDRYFLMGDPERIGRLIERVVHATRPRMRYRIGWDANLVWGLRQLLPFELYSWCLNLLIDPPVSIPKLGKEQMSSTQVSQAKPANEVTDDPN